MLLEGMFLPLTTPFGPDGRLKLRKLEQNVAHYSLTPAAGMVVLGRTGEAELLSDAETREVLATAIGSALSAKVMITGVGRASVRGTLALIDEAAGLGYDAVLVRQPTGIRPGGRESRVYFQMVADRSALPLVVEGDLAVDFVVEMGRHDRVVGWVSEDADVKQIRTVLERTAMVKRTVTVTQVFAAVTGRMMAGQVAEPGLVSAASLVGGGAAVALSPAKTSLKTRTKVVGFQVLVGGTQGMLEGLLAGAMGAIPPFAAAAPQACYEVMAAWKDGDTALAEEKQLRIVEAARRIEGELGVAGVKYGCDLNGYFGGVPRLPLLPLMGAERAEIDELMAGLKS